MNIDRNDVGSSYKQKIVLSSYNEFLVAWIGDWEENGEGESVEIFSP